MSIKLIQLNIEGDKHIDKIVPFFEREKPEVVCLQEVNENTFNRLKEKFGWSGVFAPMCKKADLFGVALLSALPIESSIIEYYWKDENSIPDGDRREGDLEWLARALIMANIVKAGKSYTVTTTHFPKNHKGNEVADFQRRDYAALSKILSQYPNLIFTGDTNCPRGTEIFDDLAKKYKDNIPADVITTLDLNLHIKGQSIFYVVDGLFTTPNYQVQNIKLVGGVSDHLALVVEIDILG